MESAKRTAEAINHALSRGDVRASWFAEYERMVQAAVDIYEASRVKEQFPRARKHALLAYLGRGGVETPHRKPRGGQLTEAQREENRKLGHGACPCRARHSPSQRVQDRARELSSCHWLLPDGRAHQS
jgi:hypothetical protein